MIDLKRRKRTVTIFFVIAYIMVVILIVGSCFVNVLKNSYEEATGKVGSFIDTYESTMSKTLDSYKGVDSDLLSRTRLSALAAGMDDPETLEPSAYNNGFIVKVEGDNLITPAGFPADAYVSAASFSDEYDIWGSDDERISYARITGPFYYFEKYTGNDINVIDSEDAYISGALSNLANSIGCNYLYIESGEVTKFSMVMSGTNELSGIGRMDKLGLSDQDYQTFNRNGALIASVSGKMQLLRLMEHETDGISHSVIVLIPLQTIFLRAMQQSNMPLIVILVLSIVLMTWVISIHRTVLEKVLTAEERARYSPGAAKRKMAIAIAVSALIVCMSSLYILSLDSLFIRSSEEASVLREYFNRMEDDEVRTENSWEKSQSRYIGTAKVLAKLIDEHRDIQNAEWLQMAAEIIDADYIMIYDTNGNEVVSSASYRGMSLGTDESSATYDFRRLLRGVRSISHAAVTDEVTGLTRDMHGISLKYLSDQQAYGAMIIAVDPSVHTSAVFSNSDEAAVSLAPTGGLIAGVDPETGIIKYCNDESLKKKRMSDICREIEKYDDTFMGFVNINGTEYYASSAEHEGLIYYCAVRQSSMFKGILTRSIHIALVFAVLAALLAFILFKGYNQKYFDDVSGKELDPFEDTLIDKSKKTAENAAAAASAGLSRKQSAFMQRKYFAFLEDGISPGERVIQLLQLIIVAFTVVLSIYMILDKTHAGGAAGSDVIDYIARGNWDRGFNLFSVTAILFLLCILVVGLYILKAVGATLYGTMSVKARTTFMMLINVMNYVAIIIFVFFSLGYLGVDTRALVASAGIVGIAISLGARDLFADIIAGIMILLENTYHVGEIIEANGFRGEVAEIGMRTTKVVGRGDNVRTMRNSSIGDVINYSRLNSWYPLLLTVNSSQSLTEIENMLREELPKIAAKHSEIITGPHYRGVDSISGDRTTILILTECREIDYNKVQRDVNREVRLLFAEHKIDLM